MAIVREIIFVVAATAAVLGVTLGAVSLSRRSSAALRGRMLASALLLGLALPALLPMLPSPTARAPDPVPAATTVDAPVAASDAAIAATTPDAADPGSLNTLPALPMVAGVWLGGCAICAARLGYAHRQARRLVTGAAPLASGPQAALLAALRDESRCRLPVRLALSGRTLTPLTVGCLRPVIVLPREAIRWSDLELTAVFSHELAHIRRFDNSVALAGGLLACLHWFDPLAWWALARWRREAESACDDEVVRRGMRPSAYARVLLDRAHPVVGNAAHLTATAPFAAHVRSRLHGLLNPRTDRSATRRRTGLAIAAALVVLVLPLTALRPAVQADPLEPVPAARETGGAGGPEWLQELQVEMDEMRALNRWRRDPSRGMPLPEGVVTGDGWTLETHHAVVLRGSKYGCIFTSDEGYARVTYADGSRFGLAAFPHPPLGKFERLLDKLLVPLDLDSGGDPRGYRIDGWRDAPCIDRFRGVLTVAVASTSRSESP